MDFARCLNGWRDMIGLPPKDDWYRPDHPDVVNSDNVQPDRMTKATAEVARLLIVPLGQIGNAGGEVHPGYPGLVVDGGELQSTVWGFPLVLKGAKGQPLKPKPVNNTRADKLDSFMWRYSFHERQSATQMDDWARIADDAAHCERNSFRPGRFFKLHLGQTGCDVEIIYG